MSRKSSTPGSWFPPAVSSITPYLITLVVSLFLNVQVYAQNAEALAACPENWVARLETAEGQVQFSTLGAEDWQELNIGDCVPERSQVRIIDGRAVLSLPNDSFLRAANDTIIEFSSPAEERSWISLLKGWLHFLSRTPTEFDVETPYVNAGVKGTEFTVTAEPETQTSLVSVLEGNIVADDGSNEVSIDGGYETRFQPNQAPSVFRITDARNTVQWALHYPPLLVQQDPLFAGAREQLLHNNYRLAASTLETVPGDQRDSDYHSLYSAIDLFRGEVAQAEQRINAALNQNPDHSGALALRGVILVTKSQLQPADAAIRRALVKAQDPAERANALLAQSYLLQAQYELEQSLEAVEQALTEQPGHALLLSRQAELALMLDDYALADTASAAAVKQRPGLGHARTTRGFVLLQALQFEAAQTAFEHAIQLGPSDPLPHLGLGLIAIRKNNLKAGRHRLELAAVLDPGHSLVRSYLGKAYFTEDRDNLAATQYDLAEQMDPNDPTPWLYRAILEQNNHRPFAALAALGKSIELNDNRGVYRSRLNLDKDEAARMANQGRIYQDLGMDNSARRIASESVAAAPQNSSAHLLLAESYTSETNLDEARTSEMFQAQINQPLSATPILSIYGEPDLSVINGIEPGDLGYNEYSNLFNRNSGRAQFVSGAGNNSSRTNALVLSGLYQSVSLAAGYYNNRTDGFKDGANVEHDIFNLFSQYQVSPAWDLQFEIEVRESLVGAVEQSLLQPELADQSTTQLSDTTTYRASSNYRPFTAGNLYANLSYTKHDVAQNSLTFYRDVSGMSPIIMDYRINTDIDNDNRELDFDLRYDHRFKKFQLISGLVVGEQESRNAVDTRATVTVIRPPPQPTTTTEVPVELPLTLPESFVSQYARLYSYLRTDLSESLELTIGGSYDKMDLYSSPQQKNRYEFNPKLGAAWNVTPNIRVKTAAARNANFLNFNKRTLEPTTVSSSNQVIDNEGGTSSDIVSVGFDYVPNSEWSFGIEALDIRSEVANQDMGTFTEIDRQELKLYSNLNLRPFALSLSYNYKDAATDPNLGDNVILISKPIDFVLHKAPLEFHYHNEVLGSFLVGVNVVRQEGIFLQNSGTPLPLRRNLEENFTTFDFGYKKYYFNNNLGLSLSIENFTDKNFRLEVQGFLDPSRRVIDITPGRSVFASIRVNLN